MKEIRNSFCLLNENPDGSPRLFFENAGGSLRLKKVADNFYKMDQIPDCDGRKHPMALWLKQQVRKGQDDARLLFNVKGGTVVTAQTASQVMYQMVSTVIENVPGKNVVTSVLEHPSSFDSAKAFAQKTGMELRVAPSNPRTGGIDVDAICSLVDQNTCLLNVMYASNLTGAIMDIPAIVRKARSIKPDLYITVDAVQHAPHAVMDFSNLGIDGVNFAPYKFFGVRGIGVAWISERLARLPHPKLLAKPADFWGLGSDAPAQYATITEIVNYVCSLGNQEIEDRRERFVSGMKRIVLQERALLNALLEGTAEEPGLRKLSGVTVYTDNPDLTQRDLIIPMGFANRTPTEAVAEYVKRNVIVYDRVDTSLYSERMLHSFGLKGVVRVSPLHCHNLDDVNLFLKVTREIAELPAN